MASQRIPGLNIQVDSLHDEGSFECVGFNLKTYRVPGAHLRGYCRPVTEFEKLRTIAEGQFGTVYKVRDTVSNRVYALKKLRLPPNTLENNEVMPQNFLRQITNLKTMKHLNIVNLKEVVVARNFLNNYLVLDYCEYSLENVIDQVDEVILDHRIIKNIMHQLLAGLQLIHSYNVIHRDLCPKNVLFTGAGILKISDFGSTRAVSNVDMTPNHGLPWYRPPEILFGSTKYTKAVDIWAVGCIFGEMIRRKTLMCGNSDADIVTSMLKLLGSPSERDWPGYSDLPIPRIYHFKERPYNKVRDVFNDQSRATVAYLRKFLKYNPASRPSVEEVMNDPYYEECPEGCHNEVLIKTLHMSEKL